jgi:hypothetical protein
VMQVCLEKISGVPLRIVSNNWMVWTCCRGEVSDEAESCVGPLTKCFVSCFRSGACNRCCKRLGYNHGKCTGLLPTLAARHPTLISYPPKREDSVCMN